MLHIRVVIAAMAIVILVGASLAQAEDKPQDSAKPPESFRSKLINDPNLDRNRKDFGQCQAATSELQRVEKSYAGGKASISTLLAAERKLTATQIHYMRVSTNSRGAPAMREYLAHQGEVAAIERGLASMTALSGMVAAEDLPEVRQEAERYQEALREARRELLRAEYVWKSASRADQLRYLNRKNDPR
jgi:hypothetical protein